MRKSATSEGYPLDLGTTTATRVCAVQISEVLRVHGAALSTEFNTSPPPSPSPSPSLSSASTTTTGKNNTISKSSNSESEVEVEVEVESESESNEIVCLCQIETVLGSIIQPALEASKICGQVLEEGDMAVFMLNNIGALQLQVSISLSLRLSLSV